MHLMLHNLVHLSTSPNCRLNLKCTLLCNCPWWCCQVMLSTDWVHCVLLCPSASGALLVGGLGHTTHQGKEGVDLTTVSVGLATAAPLRCPYGMYLGPRKRLAFGLLTMRRRWWHTGVCLWSNRRWQIMTRRAVSVSPDCRVWKWPPCR